MNNIQNIKNVYFLGIGGIGMSAIARYFKFTGKNVAGYDRNRTSLTESLQQEGIDIHYVDDIRNIPPKWHPHETLAVFTPALPDDHNELNWFRVRPVSLLKRAKVLGLICNEKSAIGVSGTHGKTSISTMLATILNETEKGCGAFLGGISKNFDSNLLLPKADSPWIVAEADEFDRSFLHLEPALALVSSLDADHLDIYGEKGKIVESFEKFVSQIKPGGKLVLKKGLDLNVPKGKSHKVYRYSLDKSADFSALNVKLASTGGNYVFDLKTPDGVIANCNMFYPGRINVENMVGAAALAMLAGASANEIKAGIEKYKGVLRRFDVRFNNGKVVYIDDYAHHPEELKAVINSVRELYPGKKITGIFQPHLYSRTRDFAKEFAQSLDLLDIALLVPLYPAREEPIRGISSETIFQKMKINDKHLVSKEQAVELVKNKGTEIVMTMGAGDIDSMAEDIVKAIN